MLFSKLLTNQKTSWIIFFLFVLGVLLIFVGLFMYKAANGKPINYFYAAQVKTNSLNKEALDSISVETASRAAIEINTLGLACMAVIITLFGFIYMVMTAQFDRMKAELDSLKTIVSNGRPPSSDPERGNVQRNLNGQNRRSQSQIGGNNNNNNRQDSNKNGQEVAEDTRLQSKTNNEKVRGKKALVLFLI